MENLLIDPRLNRSGEKIWLLPLVEKERRLKEIYRKKLDCELDLEDPVSFNEKIQWYKLYYDNPDLSICVDKVTVKKYVDDIIGPGHTVKTLRVWRSPEEITFDDLPDKFVVKSNCQGEGKYIYIYNDNSTNDLDELKDEITKYWFNPVNLLINGFCRAYYDVQPKVFIEEYVEEEFLDYKFFCFGGIVNCCYVANDSVIDGRVGTSNYPISFYDLNWQMIDAKYGQYPYYYNAPKPYHLDEIIQAATDLSKNFPFVRVDFIDTPTTWYVGELTFYPGGGLKRYEPESFNQYMGSLFDITKR